jgi:hypothetical protein
VGPTFSFLFFSNLISTHPPHQPLLIPTSLSLPRTPAATPQPHVPASGEGRGGGASQRATASGLRRLSLLHLSLPPPPLLAATRSGLHGGRARADGNDSDKARSSYIRGLIPTLHRSRAGGGWEEQGRAWVPPDVDSAAGAHLEVETRWPRARRPPPLRHSRRRPSLPVPVRAPASSEVDPMAVEISSTVAPCSTFGGRTVCDAVRWRGSRSSCGSATRRGQSWHW